MKEINWLDLYICDFGESQIEDIKELNLKSKKVKTFYSEFLIPLSKEAIANGDFNYSVDNDVLTCRIMYSDLKKYYKFDSVEEILYKISEYKPSFTREKVDKLISAMKAKIEL